MPSGSQQQSLDTPLLRVPYESLKRSIRDNKYVIDDMNTIVNTINKSVKDSKCTPEQRAAELDKLISKLTRLKRKVNEMNKSEEEDMHRCKARLQHLIELGDPPQNCHVEWNKKRLDRILVDHLLRSGHHSTAQMLAKDSGIEDLVDTHIFVQAQRVVKALKGRDCREALAWCSENKSKLKRIKSNLEFKLRIQEFIQLVQKGAKAEAIAYARKSLSPWAATEMRELQRAMATLAFSPTTTCAPYKNMFDLKQWDVLTDLFLNELYRLNNLTPISVLQIHLQAGLSALKIPRCFEDNCNKEDPLSLEEFRQLSEGLPRAKHGRSKLVCSVTKEIMNEHNPPMVLPNGYVYSQEAVDIISAKNGGKMVCPVTGQSFDASSLRRAYMA